MKKVQVHTGYKVYDDDMNLIGYEGGNNGEGFVYKDTDAFENNPDEICYIPESGFDDYFDSFEDLPLEERSDFDGFVWLRHAKECGETHKTIVEQVRDEWGEEYMLTDEQVEYYAKNVFYLAEWACIATYLAENFELDDAIEYDDIKMFTQFQKEAVMNDMTPKEYAERSLSYAEIVQFDKEFDEAFVHDDDCADDESENGLGANARITYQLERRDGTVYNPEEFADLHGVKEEWRKFAKQ